MDSLIYSKFFNKAVSLSYIVLHLYGDVCSLSAQKEIGNVLFDSAPASLLNNRLIDNSGFQHGKGGTSVEPNEKICFFSCSAPAPLSAL